MSQKLRWGVLGTGRIAKQFATGLLESATGKLAAIGSRSREGGEAFAEKFPAKVHASYEGLLADPEVDAIYLSTPHPFHEEWAIRTLDAGKHLLCEKPLTINAAGAQRVIDAARRNGRFLMEAFMYRVHPQTERLLQLLKSEPIGEIRFIRAMFSFQMAYDPESRAYRHDLAGGGILDVGCYATSMSRLIAGTVSGQPFLDPVEVRGVAHIGEASRVDERALGALKFSNGILAEVAAGVSLGLENNVRIVGTEGSILVPAPWKPAPAGAFSKILLFKEGIPEEIVVDAEKSLYTYEADHVAEQIAAGRVESPALPWADTLGNMQTLDAWRESVGLRYDFESPRT
ncbi:MAG TPA: Gfo/Idh/MocA family oxidoreductase [Chthoniobacteraceae bacterium]|nr:Gfo/Idh/MocA family oxidoreductase [Chthoniobacteraceae bacterium]